MLSSEDNNSLSCTRGESFEDFRLCSLVHKASLSVHCANMEVVWSKIELNSINSFLFTGY